MNAVQLAGITPTEAGYTITPHLPMTTFGARMPYIGVARSRGLLRGYLTAQASGPLVMQVVVPPGRGSRIVSYVGRRLVPHTVRGGMVIFTVHAVAGQVLNWAVTRS